MRATFRVALLAAVVLGTVAPAWAGQFRLVSAGERVTVAKSALVVTPSQDWNHLGPRVGRNAESWTMDGLSLDDVTFYGGIASDETLFKEGNRKDKPLPRFSATMLPPDVVQMFEESYRIANDTSVFSVDKVEPTKFLGVDGVRFSYRFTSRDEVERMGLGTAAIVGGKLYMITYEAPAIYYFDKYVDAYGKIVDSGALVAKK